MKTLSIFTMAMLLSFPALSGLDVSIEKDVIELNATANVSRNTYLFIGADSNDWMGLGLGYHQFVSKEWKVASYYEFGLANDWLMDELAGIDGVKTRSHLIELSMTRFFERYSIKFGTKSEFVRNGFTWLTVDNANKFSAFVGASSAYSYVYFSAKYEYHYSIDKSDMENFNQGNASKFEISLGASKPILYVYPYVKVSAFVPHGTYYGTDLVSYSWTLGGRLNF